ncbi:NADH-quinone oxidoreductase subunit M [Myceligenerans salitolerans]|uniref:NADH-quinone oxidoreductase subunit M n=1 Tax=Myceligenerans salitolerans TaxID=1230528 RepID=A0ABS3I737_9MICO|nr:NADH-quinone oxidoreductase subunit M [Myceligenerans salitolerans]MBO0608769.1 NADH-quinone oxidoreductase subunit M [Myceligenerans salitolerans]
MTFPWLTTLVVFPLVAAAAVWLPGLVRTRRGSAGGATLAKTTALGAALVEVLLLIGAFVEFDTATAAEYQLSETYAWIPQIGASYALGVDGVSLLLIALAVVLVPLVLAAAWREQGDNGLHLRRYTALVLILEALMVAVFAARDVFLFYVLFEAVLIPAYFLIGGFGQGPRRRRAAVRFLMFSLAGGLIMLAAVIALYFQVPVDPETGLRPEDAFLTANLTGLELDTVAGRLMFAGFFIAFAIKAPMVPVHTWLPDVAGNATPGTSTLLICVLDKIGTFGMLTLCLPLFPEASRWAAPLVIGLAVVSVLYGAIAAIGQTDLLRLVGWTSVSHFGFIILGIFTFTELGTAGSAFMMLNHGLATGALFLTAGFLIARHPEKSQVISDYSGLRTVTPVLAGTFLVAGLATLSLPGLATFASEIMVLVGAFGDAPGWTLAAVPGVVLAALYILLTYQKMFTGDVAEGLDRMPDIGRRERLVAAPLVLGLLVLGLVPQLALDYVDAPATEAVAAIEAVADGGADDGAAGADDTGASAEGNE